MADPPKPLTGSCLCGSVTYSADAEPLAQAICHCTDCQRQSGSVFSTVVVVPRPALVVEGDTLSSFATTSEGTDTENLRHFCSACGSPIFSLLEATPDLAYVKVGTLDDPSWFEPTIEVFARSAYPWSPHFEHATSFEQGPG